MKNLKNIFWGVLLLLGAVAVLASSMGYLEGFNVGHIILTVILAAGVIEGVLNRSIGTILFSVAGIVIVNDELLGLEEITPWPVLCAAILGTIGLNMIFPESKRKHKHVGVFVNKPTEMNEESVILGENGEEVNYETAFGESVKYINSDNLAMANLECNFGSLNVYFNEATLANGVAEVNVECSFGAIELYVPSTWRVDNDAHAVFGAVDETGRCNPDGNHVLKLHGGVKFGAVEIHYV
jgi:predicted membrane protein